jgi:sulfonate dioxygenase
MAPSAVSTETSVDPVANSLASLKLQGRSLNAEAYTTPPNPQNPDEEPYLWTRLLPVFDPSEHYPPLTPYEHVDPGFRALSHPNPRSFLSSATRVADLTPHIGTEIEGVNLATLDADGRDQLALEAARRGVLVFRDQEEFLNSRTDAWKKWGEHFGRLHIHPTSGHPAGVPEIHLVYRDSSKSFNFEQDDHITSTVWHSDVSYEVRLLDYMTSVHPLINPLGQPSGSYNILLASPA